MRRNRVRYYQSMNPPASNTIDPLAVGQEPTDEQLAEVMAEVGRVARERRVLGEARMREMMAADFAAAQVRMEYLRKQFNLARR